MNSFDTHERRHSPEIAYNATRSEQISHYDNPRKLDSVVGTDRYYLVREDILPEAVLKTMMVKDLLAHGEVKTVGEAVEKVGISRSAFYKYKDGIHALSKLDRERIITISMDLQHRSGILSQVLALVARFEGNVLTIHQTIPLQGMANVVISVDTSKMGERIPVMLSAMHEIEGVNRAHLIGQG